jgi:adenosylhomocysteine nucleosidase
MTGFIPVPLEPLPFRADPTLLALAETLPDVRVGGIGISGDVFVNDPIARDNLFNLFTAHVVDMESAAVAQVAMQNHTPFLIIRAVSDRAGGEAENEVARSMEAAVLAACNTLRDILRGL